MDPPEVLARTFPSTSPMRMEPPEVDTDAVPEQLFREMDPPEVLPSTGPSMWPKLRLPPEVRAETRP